MKFHAHGCGGGHNVNSVPVWMPSPLPACIEIIDHDDCYPDWFDWPPQHQGRRHCRHPFPPRRHRCPPLCLPPCPPPCPPLCLPPCPPSAPPVLRQLEFAVCAAGVWQVLCVEAAVACARWVQNQGLPCLWVELCVTLQYRDTFCNCYTHTQSVTVECCDIPFVGGCHVPRVDICGPPLALICDGQIKITLPVGIC